MKINFTNYTDREEDEKIIPDCEIKTIEMGYDGGRFYFTINGEEIYSTKLAGNDFCFEIN